VLLGAGERPQVTHQAGAASRAVRAAYASAGVSAEVLPFIDDMPQRLADATVMVCRAGAITVSELCARRAGDPGAAGRQHHGTPARQRGVDGQQGAAVHLPQPELTPAKLSETLRRLDRPALLAMAARRAAWPGRRRRARCREIENCERMKHALRHITFVGSRRGMSAIAEILHRQGYRVSGSDQSASATTRRLPNSCRGPHRSRCRAHCGAQTVVTPPPWRPTTEVQAARARRIPVVRARRAAGELMRFKRGIAIPARMARPPPPRWWPACWPKRDWTATFLIGGKLQSEGANARWRRRAHVVEADKATPPSCT